MALYMVWYDMDDIDYNSFISATITISSGANPARVAQRCIAKDIRGLGSQSELAFNAIRCFSI